MELVNISYTGTGTEAQNYSNIDNSLISNNYINTSFLANSNDYIEAFIYDDSNNLLNSDYNLTDYTLPSNSNSNNGTYTSINLDPQTYVNNLGFDRGSINVQYNFLRTLFNSSFVNNYWIKQISSTRTELLLASQNISDSNILNGFNSYQSYAANKNYFSDFYLNFGNNQLIIGVNAAYSSDSSGAYLLIKLYEPLPLDFDIKSTLWIVDKIAESANYNVNIQIEVDAINNQNNLRGPNFKIEVNQKLGLTTPYYNYNNLLSSPVTSSFQKLMSYYQDQSININVDYSNFSNFIHFSSATERISNFVYKLGLIESYNSQIQSQKSVTGGNLVASSSIGFLSQSINNIITNFDNYEYYLYFTSASFAWPKTNNTQPYTLASVNSTAGLNWLGNSTTQPVGNNISILYSASYYDLTNKDLLTNSIPRYLQDDPNNIPYSTFVYMMGQHFDNIWIYYKDVTNRYNNTNNPNTGVSMDLVGDALRGLGMHLYTNSNVSDNLYYSLFGINANGNLLPPTGSERITNFVTSSIATLPAQTIQNEIYKRIYHNLPYLLKTKGTHRGLKALIACYGIPESILTVNEFGGYDSSVQDGLLEINNLKAYTVTSSLQISASVLSPYISNQYYQTNRRINSSKIEIGFSPADSINAFITGSLGYFNIDQLIGNPNDQYSASYQTLEAFKNTTFSTYATYPNHSIGEYIRMIKFYNNSLFKMIKDFVPARANVSTGIIVKPHILERSKYARHQPTVTSSSLVSEISGSKISGSDPSLISKSTAFVKTEYSTLGLIPVSHSVGFEKFTGEFSGSSFKSTYHNKSQIEKSYQPFQNLNLGYTPSQSINFGALYQNISSSIRSNTFFHLDFGGILKNQATNYGYITQSIILGNSYQSNPNSQYAYVQDYNYNLRRSIIPRYSGSFSMAKTYNIYTTGSGNYGGDISYGNDPMINYYSNKIGLFTQVETSSFIPGEINATLTYLVDVSGGLQELNQNNTHWTDIQNIFLQGSTATIKQFDNKKYGNQKATDGIKTIYNSGYSYSPQLYFVTGVDTQLFFTYTGNSAVSNFIAWNPSTTDVPASNAYIKGGGGSPYYAPTITSAPTRTGNIYNIFGSSGPSVGYTPGTVGVSFPYYTPTVAGVSSFSTKFSLTVTLPDPLTQGGSTDTAIYAYQVYLNGSLLPGSSTQLMSFSSTYTAAVTTNASITTLGALPGTVTGLSNLGVTTLNLVGPININGTPIGSSSDNITLALCQWYQGSSIRQGYLVISGNGPLGGIPTSMTSYITIYGASATIISNPSPSKTTTASSNYSKTFNINYTTPGVSITPADKVYFQLIQQSVTTDNYIAYLSVGSSNSSLGLNTAAIGAGGYPYATSSVANGNFIYAASNNTAGTSGSLVLSQNLSNYLGYQFVPYFVSASVVYSSSLYSISASYGDVSYAFQPQFGDRIVLSDGSRIENLDVVGYSVDSNNRVNISVIPTILSSWVSNPNNILQFLLLRKYADEQNVQLTFVKKPGQTSYGFLIPNNINPEVLLKINTIQSQVQSQILSTQINTNG